MTQAPLISLSQIPASEINLSTEERAFMPSIAGFKLIRPRASRFALRYFAPWRLGVRKVLAKAQRRKVPQSSLPTAIRHSFTCRSAFSKKIAFVAFPLAALLLLQIILCAQDEPSKDVTYYQKQAINAYKAKDFLAAVENVKKAAALVPNYPRLIYNIAALQSLLGNKSEALKALTQLADMGLVLAVEKDEDFAAIKDSDEFQAVLKKFAANRAPVVKSEAAFTVDEKGLITESVAYDPTTETFYISSVHKRKIISVDKNGAMKTFATEQDGLWSVLGMKVDAKRRHLWVTSSAFPQMINFRKADEGLSGVFKFDLNSGRLIKKYLLPNLPAHHALGDLNLNSRGAVFATDSLTPALYVIHPQKDELELFLENPRFASPQGLTFSTDEKHLFMADYARGIFDIEVNTKKIAYLQPPPSATLHGIDGLYFYKGDLIATQNGVNPNRIVRLSLSPDFTRCINVAVIEANNPLFDEPTLGVIVKDTFYFIANSQWGKIDDNGKLAPAEKLQNPLVVRVKL
jgi:hypothetical protein